MAKVTEIDLENAEREALQRVARHLTEEASALPDESAVALDLQRAAEACLRRIPTRPPGLPLLMLSIVALVLLV